MAHQLLEVPQPSQQEVVTTQNGHPVRLSSQPPRAYRVNTRPSVLDRVDGVVRDDRHAGELLKEEDDGDEQQRLPHLGPLQMRQVRAGYAPLRRLLRPEQRPLEALQLGIVLE